MRGIIVPIVDLRLKFTIGHANYLERTVVIVFTYQSKDKSRTIGFVVDTVSDVFNVEQADIKPVPAFGGCVSAITLIQDKNSSLIWGMPGKVNAISAHTIELPLIKTAKNILDYTSLNRTEMKDVLAKIYIGGPICIK